MATPERQIHATRIAEDVPSGQGPAEVLARPYLPRPYVLFSSITRAGSNGSRNGKSEGNLDQAIGIGGKRVRRRKGSEGIGGWLEEVRREERGCRVVIVVRLGRKKYVGAETQKKKKIIKIKK